MRPVLRSIFAIVLLLASGLAAEAAPPPDAIRAEIGALLSSGQRLPLPLEKIRPALTAHYLRNNGSIYWVGTGRMDALLQRMGAAGLDGLNPEDYPADALTQLRDAVGSDDASEAAKAELYYSAFFVAYAADLKIGRVTPQKVDPNLFRSPKTMDALRALTDLKKQQDPGKFLTNFEPKNKHYQVLKRILKAYVTAINQGIAWPVIDQGATLKPGQRDARVPKVRELLAFTGDFAGSDETSPVYDAELSAAVKKFQVRHGLEAKGLFGKQTIVAMNIPPEARRKQIIVIMERWRWMPDDLGSEHFLVNIAAFELQHVMGGQTVDRMNVVVGAVATQTPEFSGEMQYVEMNPTWTVPYTIATTEMLAKLRANPMQYADDFDVFYNGKIVDWNSISWASYGPGTFPFTFRQRPGPKNALGKVKFMLPNSHNIYLHDTPAKDKFANTTRAFSHGCIRLSRPADLAYEMLQEEVGMSREQVDAIWANGETQRIDFPRKIPVHIVYATAFATDNGIEFRTDVYGRDQKLYAALFGRTGS